MPIIGNPGTCKEPKRVIQVYGTEDVEIWSFMAELEKDIDFEEKIRCLSKASS